MDGRIKIHRKILERGRYSDVATRSLFMHLLILCSHKDHHYQWQPLNPGQCTIWRKATAKTLGLTEQSIRTALNRLKSTNEITIKSTNKYSIITVLRRKEYQSQSPQSTNKSTNKSTNNQPTTNQQLTTNKELKKERTKEINKEFEKFWNSYDKKVWLEKTLKKRSTLTDKERADIFLNIPHYKASKPDKKYRRDPTTYLNNRTREDEILPPDPKFNKLDPKSEAYKHRKGTRKDVNKMSLKELWMDFLDPNYEKDGKTTN